MHVAVGVLGSVVGMGVLMRHVVVIVPGMGMDMTGGAVRMFV
ncbi:hypothetical protein [Mycolicibacterium moriokaense]|uniref:Uncharacterized protein n=1 Tax=Mycolicibacterium moriokaense TaxID=39691 RepID=A0AAD1HEG9_9MYCO|nr:hypothetical protein [Mycolicibacterium moriokaense]BBX03290.1 hypothetical protein MMOR_42260 [Mycolicibacterium moriokaense]